MEVTPAGPLGGAKGMVWLWITSQKSPLNTSNPPSVMMNAGMRSRTMSAPISDQSSSAIASATSIATPGGQGGIGSQSAAVGPSHRWSSARAVPITCPETPPPAASTAAMPPMSPTPLPALRSMWPGKMTSSIPIASVAVIASSVTRSERLRAERNCGERIAKNAQMPINAKASAKSRRVSREVIGVVLLRAISPRPRSTKRKTEESRCHEHFR